MNIIQGTSSQFFPDQQVHAADLNNVSYTSIQNLREYLKGATKVPGVCLSTFVDSTNVTSGPLAVTCNNGGTLLSIAPGLGIDSQGRMILVPKSTLASGSIGVDPLYYPARPSVTNFDPAVTGAGTYYVNIYHTVLYGSQETDDSGAAWYTRAYDSYRVAVEPTPTTIGLTLARAGFNASGSLALSSDLLGYVAGDGKRYALFDDRIGHEFFDRAVGKQGEDIEKLNAAVFNEELEMSTGFIFPADGHSVTTRIHRDARILRMELYMETSGNEAGTVNFQFFSGSSPQSLQGPLGEIATSTPGSIAVSNELNLAYQRNHTLMFKLSRADDSVTRATATLVYKRR